MFVVRRLLLTIPMLFVMSVVVFLIIRLVPGDPVRTMLGFRATEENVARAARPAWPRPAADRTVLQLGRRAAARRSRQGHRHPRAALRTAAAAPAGDLRTHRALHAARGAVGVPLGIRAATGGRWTRALTESFVVFGISVPDFWLGIMLVLIFSATLAILPPSGYMPFATDPIGNLRYMALPVLTLAAGEAAYILRTTRGAITSVMDRPFVTFLRAKGISQNRIVFGHALRNAGPSIVTVIGIQVGVLLGGAIIIETMFAMPGVGRLIVTAINQRNYPVVQVGILAIATIFIVVSLVTDLIVAWLDPRVADGGAR